jgi:quinol---cytochrome c reductase iron-sulfur subunit, bacillus type
VIETSGERGETTQADAGVQPRRGLLKYVAGAVATFVGIVVGAPAIAYLGAPLARKESANWIPVGPVNSFAPGIPKLVALTISRAEGWRQILQTRTCWVSISTRGEIMVFNGRCTHLGCAYSWQTQGRNAGTFLCPCHEGTYSADGAVLSGPPPRPLDELESRIEADQLVVKYEDFQLGTPSKESV